MVSKNMKQTREVPNNVKVLPVGISHSILGKVKMFLRQYRKINKDTAKKLMIHTDSKGSFIKRLYCYYFESRAMEVYDHIIPQLDKNNFEQYDSVTIYSYWLYITSRLAVELKNDKFRDREVHTVSRAHRYDLYENAAPLKYLPERDYLLNSLDAVYPCSEDGVDSLINTYPAHKEKLEVARLGTVSRNIVSQTDFEKLYIVSCSIVRKVKRLDLLIEALVGLEQKKIPYLWTHIGDGPEYETIKNLAEKKLAKENYQFTGFMKNKEVLTWYQDNPATVFVNLSSSEGVPVAIMEASSMSLPVLATDVGGTREIVNNNINGFLLPENPETAQIIRYLEKFTQMNKLQYEKMSNDAFRIWNEKSNAKVLYKNFADKLKEDSLKG